MESKYILILVIYLAGGIVALGWWHKRTLCHQGLLLDAVLVFFGYPLVILFKFGQLFAR